MEFLNATFSADTQGLTGGSKRGANINTLPTSLSPLCASTSTVDHVVIQDLVEVVRGHSARGHTRDNPSVLAGWSPVQVARDSALVIR
ncbi:hypothetical protein PC115_g19234 [Phytophthora cactorum]|uniref:Uncharacterized protein n=1 Tax=Phytophthora cactorum TaxID=29920 RepID=A0A8T1AVW3_9STRA|nr:hypothetical protein PC115_g19234 [Phytophthora cactorum]